ncbi:MAG: response regulator [Pseudomonadota bacterium]
MDTVPPKQIVLIVDDEPINIKMLAQALRAGYEVVVATNGPDAVARAGSAPQPDLILLDVMMPEMDGYEVCRKVKTEPGSRNIPVIFLTARTDDQDETRALEMGAVDYIRKPFNQAIVQARVKTHLDLKRHRDFIEMLLREKTSELAEAQKEYMYLFLRGGR